MRICVYVCMGNRRKQDKYYLFPQNWAWEGNNDTNADRYTNMTTDNDISSHTTTFSNTNNGTSINISVW